MDQQTPEAIIAKQFAQLPKIVQDSITSAEMEKHLRQLSQKHQLHLDQWSELENEVLMVVLGLAPTNTLEQQLITKVRIPSTVAHELAQDINYEVFEPIRLELEQSLTKEAAQEDASDPTHLTNEIDPAPLQTEAPMLLEDGELPELPSGNPSVPPPVISAEAELASQAAPAPKEAAAASDTTPKAKRGTLDPQPGLGITLPNAAKPAADPYREAI